MYAVVAQEKQLSTARPWSTTSMGTVTAGIFMCMPMVRRMTMITGIRMNRLKANICTTICMKMVRRMSMLTIMTTLTRTITRTVVLSLTLSRKREKGQTRKAIL
jgi:hypothetical protein